MNVLWIALLALLVLLEKLTPFGRWVARAARRCLRRRGRLDVVNFAAGVSRPLMQLVGIRAGSAARHAVL